MYEIRIHGRGGQGVVTAASLLASAVYLNGKFVQAFPSFGVERRGAPVQSYVRVSDKPILLRSQIYNPQALIIQDSTLIGDVDVFQGVSKDTVILINSEKSFENIKDLPKGVTIYTVPGTKIALDYIGKPVLNTVLLGAFARINNIVSKNSIKKAILEKFPSELAKKNIDAMNEAFKKVI